MFVPLGNWGVCWLLFWPLHCSDRVTGMKVQRWFASYEHLINLRREVRLKERTVLLRLLGLLCRLWGVLNISSILATRMVRLVCEMGTNYYVGGYNSGVSKLDCNILHHQFISCNISLARCVVTVQHSIHSPLAHKRPAAHSQKSRTQRYYPAAARGPCTHVHECTHVASSGKPSSLRPGYGVSPLSLLHLPLEWSQPK